MPWFLIALAIVALSAAFVLLMPKPKFENARAGGLNDLNFPRASENAPIPLILGKCRTKGPNTLWAGDFLAKPIKKKQKTGMFSSKKVVVGHEYFVGVQLGLGIGPCSLHTIWMGKEILWQGEVSADGTAIVINKPNFFGGKEKGGGFIGTIRFYSGGWTQGINAYLETQIGAGLVPAYRGTCYIVLEHCNIGEQNSLREMSFEVSRYSNGLGLGGGIEKVGDDMNPMELMWQIFTSDWGGLNVGADMFDVDSFQAVAQTLFDETNGMSLLISTPNGGKEITQEVTRQADGLLYCNPETGQIVSRLIRNDYNIDDLPIFDESNILTVRSFSSKLWEDTINQVRISYTDRAKKYEQSSAMVQDLANISAQERIRSATQSFPGCTNPTLASQLASRELSQSSVPLMSVMLETNRQGAALRPGDPFVWAWDGYSIDRVVMRVRDFDLGSLNNNRVAFQAMQDEFAVHATVFTPPVSSGGNPTLPVVPPVPSASRLVTEGAHYFANVMGLNISDAQGVLLVAASAPTGSDEYDIHTSIDAGVTYEAAEESVVYNARGELVAAVTATQNLSTGVIPSLTFTGTIEGLEDYSAAEVGQGAGLFLLGGELLAYETFTDNGGGSFTLENVWRALLDTAPIAHAIGAVAWFIEGDAVIDVPFASTQAVRVKVLPRTFRDQVLIADAPYDSVTLNKRAARPLAPANIKFDGGAAFTPPATPNGPKVITWANRNRKSLVIRKITDATNEFEPGQETVIRYRKNGGAWVSSLVAPGVTTATIDAGAVPGDTVDYELYAAANGVDSFSKYAFSAGSVSGTGSVPTSGTSTGGSGSGGGAAPAPTDTNPVYAIEGWVQIVIPFGQTVGVDPLDIPITQALTLPANLGDIAYSVRANPVAIATFTLKRRRAGVDTTIGSLVISTGGVVTGTTTAGAAIDFLIDDVLVCQPPTPTPGALEGVSFTIPAIKKKV